MGELKVSVKESKLLIFRWSVVRLSHLYLKAKITRKKWNMCLISHCERCRGGKAKCNCVTGSLEIRDLGLLSWNTLTVLKLSSSYSGNVPNMQSTCKKEKTWGILLGKKQKQKTFLLVVPTRVPSSHFLRASKQSTLSFWIHSTFLYNVNTLFLKIDLILHLNVIT